uniref:LOW QUALITY PROTEIN: X-box-binding protein 1 n=1 Tax=Pristiophorus japonicus TaxID=55135 RepID=UPI00398F8302
MVAMTAAGSAKVLLIPGGQPNGLEVSRHISVVYPAQSGLLHDSSSPAPGSSHAHRKRQRLTHLSPEEKALRRKLKNRVAAQTARDRKKARMSELEEQVLEMESENEKLHIENRLLHEKTHILLSENQELRQRLGMEALDTEKEKVLLQARVDEISLAAGSAERSTQTTCASAAGAGPAVCQSDNFHMDTDSIDSSDSESDLFLGILDYFDPEILLRFSEESRSFADLGQCAYSENTGSLPASPSDLLGAPSTKLEAINELIHFDHFYHKPLAEASLEQSNETAIKIEQASFSGTDKGIAEDPLQMELKQEPIEDEFITELGLTNILSSQQSQEKPICPLDSSNDSDYERSPSPLSDMSSPLTLGNSWEDTFPSELFPQLIAV